MNGKLSNKEARAAPYILRESTMLTQVILSSIECCFTTCSAVPFFL